jgi:hypothetical protein
MTPLPEPVARELERHKFPNPEAKEIMIARLLNIWRVLHSSGPDGDDTDHDTDRSRQANRRRRWATSCSSPKT